MYTMEGVSDGQKVSTTMFRAEGGGFQSLECWSSSVLASSKLAMSPFLTREYSVVTLIKSETVTTKRLEILVQRYSESNEN